MIGNLKEHQAELEAKGLRRKQGVSDAAFNRWRAKFGDMGVSDAKKLKALEAENAKLKKLLAEQMMDVSALKKLGKKPLRPGARRRAVDSAMTQKEYWQQ